jgi:hypothetical protein
MQKIPFPAALSGRHSGTVLADGRALCLAARYLFVSQDDVLRQRGVELSNVLHFTPVNRWG